MSFFITVCSSLIKRHRQLNFHSYSTKYIFFPEYNYNMLPVFFLLFLDLPGYCPIVPDIQGYVLPLDVKQPHFTSKTKVHTCFYSLLHGLSQCRQCNWQENSTTLYLAVIWEKQHINVKSFNSADLLILLLVCLSKSNQSQPYIINSPAG